MGLGAFLFFEHFFFFARSLWFFKKVRRETKKQQGSPLEINGRTPLEAILVIFGRRALIFFLFESSWKKMKNDTTFVRMRSGDHLGDVKMSKKGTSLRRI